MKYALLFYIYFLFNISFYEFYYTKNKYLMLNNNIIRCTYKISLKKTK